MSDTSPTKSSRRFRPSHVALLLGAFWAVLTFAAGTASAIFGFHDDSPVSRPDFLNIPSAVKGVFYGVLTVMFLAVGYLFSLRIQNWERGQPDRRKTTGKNARHRIEAFRSGVWMRTLLRDGAAGLMHSLIYFPFLVLFAVTNLVIFNEQVPRNGSSSTVGRTRRSPSAPTSPASCSSSASAGRCSAATSSACTASASRAAPKT
jgi:hypothetical protein